MFSWALYFNHNRPFFFFFSFLLCCCFVLFCFYVSFTSFFLLKSCARFLFVAVFSVKENIHRPNCKCSLCMRVRAYLCLNCHHSIKCCASLFRYHKHYNFTRLSRTSGYTCQIAAANARTATHAYHSQCNYTLRLSIYLKRPILSMNGYSKDMRSAYPIGIRFNTVISFGMKNTWHLKHEDNELAWSKLCTDFTDLKTQFTSVT